MDAKMAAPLVVAQWIISSKSSGIGAFQGDKSSLHPFNS
jgi:hypothetical protein